MQIPLFYISYISFDNGATWQPIPYTLDYRKRFYKGDIKSSFYNRTSWTQKIPFAPNLGKVIVYPNPYIPSKGHTYVYFANLTQEATIRIYDLSGALIKELKAGERWNPKAEGIASGVYIYVIKDHKEYKTGKLAIIR